MHLQNKGQSVLEYVLLATVVFLGIVIGGPALTNGIRGYFKMYTESVDDADSENIQSEDGEAGVKKPCECSAWSQGECGVGACSAVKRYSYRRCSPMKCDVEEKCEPDTECCTSPAPVSCGSAMADIQCTSWDSRSPVDAKIAQYFSSEFKSTCNLNYPD